MSMEKLRDSLITEAQVSAAKIIGAAESQAKAMLEEERMRGISQKAQVEEEIERLLNDQRNERSAWARLEAKRIVAEAREDSVKNSMESVLETLGTLRKSPEYKRFIKDSIEHATSELGNDLLIHVLKGEKDLLPKIKGVKVVEDLDCLGGVVAESTDGKFKVNLTFESLYDLHRDDLRKTLYDKLFGGK